MKNYMSAQIVKYTYATSFYKGLVPPDKSIFSGTVAPLIHLTCNFCVEMLFDEIS